MCKTASGDPAMAHPSGMRTGQSVWYPFKVRQITLPVACSGRHNASARRGTNGSENAYVFRNVPHSRSAMLASRFFVEPRDRRGT
jgi:hypothetical protein